MPITWQFDKVDLHALIYTHKETQGVGREGRQIELLCDVVQLLLQAAPEHTRKQVFNYLTYKT